MSNNSKMKELVKSDTIDINEINQHVSAVLDEHLDMISAAHQSTHGSDHKSVGAEGPPGAP